MVTEKYLNSNIFMICFTMNSAFSRRAVGFALQNVLFVWNIHALNFAADGSVLVQTLLKTSE